MIKYFKAQWFRILMAIICFVFACVYAFQPAPDPTTIEGINETLRYMITTCMWVCNFLFWVLAARTTYNNDRLELLEAKAEKYDALCEEVSALAEANRIDREYIALLDAKIDQLRGRYRE